MTTSLIITLLIIVFVIGAMLGFILSEIKQLSEIIRKNNIADSEKNRSV